jgi:hypothetical protein
MRTGVLVVSSDPLLDGGRGWVVAMLDSPTDLRTVGAWARFVGVSPATIGEICRLLEVQPHDARDLGRMLRALTFAHRSRLHLEGVLDVSDRRTLQKLIARAAVADKKLADLSLTEFLTRQQFVSADNEGLRALKAMLP